MRCCNDNVPVFREIYSGGRPATVMSVEAITARALHRVYFYIETPPTDTRGVEVTEYLGAINGMMCRLH